MSEKDQQNSQENNNVDKPEVAQELSQVATSKKQSIAVFVVIGIVFLYLIYTLFFSGDDANKNPQVQTPKEVVKPIQDANDNSIPDIPILPTPPELEEPTPPIPPIDDFEAAPPEDNTNNGPALPALPVAPNSSNVSLPDSSNSNLFAGKEEQDLSKRKESKRKSSIMLVSGSQQASGASSTDPSQATNSQTPGSSSASSESSSDFTFRGDMNYVLGRGKLLSAIIETPLNTDIGGEIRAIISRDVYSEWGKNILIPKGSRVFGNYATGISGSYGRISVEWTRIDLINGYTMNLSGTGADNLGRKGNQGRVDSKFKERFSNSVMRSAFNIVLAKGLDSFIKPATSSSSAESVSALASAVLSTTTGIITNAAYADDTAKVNQLCPGIPNLILNNASGGISSSMYTTIKAACDATYATDTAKLNAVIAAINSSATSTATSTAASVTETKAQTASQQAFTDISDIVKTLIEEQALTPTITIDQGTPIRIYVNKDYLFPKEVLMKKGL